MPKIDSDFIQSAFYLYRNREDAVLGRDAQGTGFDITVTLGKGLVLFYSNTNRQDQ